MKNKILVCIFIIYIGSFSILSIIIPDKEISITERRTLSKFPNIKFNSEWIKDVDKYLLEQFVLRDQFRSIKANYNYYFLNSLDNNGIYLKDNYIYKNNYPTDNKSIENFKNKISKLNSLLTPDNNVYMIIIPDKNYYLDSKDFLYIDYDYIYKEVSKLNLNMIDIRDIMKLEYYYQTDTHWRQEKLEPVIKKISDIMNFNYKKTNYHKEEFNNFYGVYYGESALARKPEKLFYLTNEIINNTSVKYLENPNLKKVYNVEKLNSLDAYNVYLDGASSFIEITNPLCEDDRELVVFRDSFGSSLSPLLIEYYSKITIIDNRYISSEIFENMIKFSNQDVLYVYSTLIINDSYSLKG